MSFLERFFGNLCYLILGILMAIGITSIAVGILFLVDTFIVPIIGVIWSVTILVILGILGLVGIFTWTEGQ